MTPTETILLLIGLAIGCVILAHLLSIGAFSIRKKVDVSAHDWTLTEHHDNLKDAAMPALYRGPKGARPGYQRSNFK